MWIDRFNEHAQEWIKHTVWKDACRSWYKNNETGRVNAVWPGSSLHYCWSLYPSHVVMPTDNSAAEVIKTPRWEDYEFSYHYSNPWAYIGMGANMENATPGADYSPYLQLEHVDPKWVAFVSGKSEEEAMAAIAEGAVREKELKDAKANEGPEGSA